MNSHDEEELPIRTVIKYEKTSCYFCNEWLESQTFKEHLIHCGQVLEPCPNGCSAYIQRKKMRSHLRDCPKLNMRTLTSNGLDGTMESRIEMLEQDISALRSVLNEEIRQRLHLITDVGSLRKQNQVSDEWNQETDQIMGRLQKLINQESELRIAAIEECQHDFRYNYDLTQTIKTDLENSINQLEKEISDLTMETKRSQNRITESLIKLDENVMEQENSFKLNFKQLELFVHELSSDLKTRYAGNTEVSAKQLKMDYEIKSMKNIVCETEDKCEKLEKLVRDVDKALHHTMQSLSDLEVNLMSQYKMYSIQNTKGHLLWRISDFQKKFDEAKQHDTVLQSPIFCNKSYGYTLRVEMYLNGKGSWKGRNIIACLNVIPGEYDPLLTWPCKLQADVLIRDQNTDPTGVQDYVKTVVVRRKSDEFQSNQFFYIPHKILGNRHYIKDDTLFLEIYVHKNKYL
ncbi:TNF receptor-associated factor 5 [Episyrphus balteatus]|uniref:TNF receptor-associated factor 5 n=1 Tax=Episyrphus balteatus TaxID=286459 RepID=UPI0024866944|nr:TNF receptor-associated factor 5 [Episyrphus balteatus]